jgi:PucR-like helix-turn-helix protein
MVTDAAGADAIASVLASRRDELIDAAMDVIRSRVPAYRDADPALLDEVRDHIAVHHDLLCSVLRRGRPVEPRELEFIGRHAAHRARSGIALAEFLEAFRSYNAVVWDAVAEAASTDAQAAAEALEAARAASLYVDLATTEASGAYLESQQLLLAGRDRVRRDLLEDLLAGRPPAAAASLAAARDAGLEEGARCLVVAALPVQAPEDEGVLLAAASALAAALGGRRPPLAVARRGEIVLVRAVGEDERAAPAAALARACGRLQETRGLTLGVGVSTVQDVAGLGGAYREASLALGRMAGTGGVLSLPDLSAFEFLTLRDSDVARRLIAPEVERFVREDRESGGMLIRTLLAYVEADLNVKAAAEKLLIHVNTAHHRLGRIEEKTGRNLRRVPDLVDLLIAIRLPA